MFVASLALAATLTLRVATFNIEHGGTAIDFGKVVEAIRASGADVVGIEEAEGRIPRLARELGWHGNARLQIVSRFPIVDPPGGNGFYVYIQTSPGEVVAMANVHLPSDPYGPEVARTAAADDVMALERRLRMPMLERVLAGLADVVASGVPLFLTGDFNAPSHRDWIPAAVGSRPQVRYALAWPETAALEAAGFHDSYREVHPDPVAAPGLTWWAVRPPLPDWNPKPSDPQDRIDFVFAAGPAQARSSLVVGERGGPGVDIGIRPPWPSDHRAVVSTFTITPARSPILVSVEPRLTKRGDPLRITFHAPGRQGDRVALVKAGGSPAPVAEQPTGKHSLSDGSLTFPTTALTPGAFAAELRDASGAALASYPFWIAGGAPTLSASRDHFAVGEPVVLAWSQAPGNRWDWVAIYAEDADFASESYLVWRHTGTAIEGSAVMDASAEGEGWPLKPGRYVAYLFSDDRQLVLAKAAFTVDARPW